MPNQQYNLLRPLIRFCSLEEAFSSSDPPLVTRHHPVVETELFSPTLLVLMSAPGLDWKAERLMLGLPLFGADIRHKLFAIQSLAF